MSRALVLFALALSACDYNGDFLFPSVSDQAPELYELKSVDGGALTPVDITSPADIEANTIYGEVGAPTSAQKGGVTFTFFGTGAEVCVFMDPEAIYWTESVAPIQDDNSRPWSYPDNVFDDGDLDISGGLSVYYTGSADEIGDFKVRYEDSLGNPVEVSLAVCTNTSELVGTPNAHSGRGTPEFCTFATDAEVQYTIVMETFSTPLDDDRLSFGLLLANGGCDDLIEVGGGAQSVQGQECVIRGEALRPEQAGPWYGYGEIESLIHGTLGGSFLDFEAEFCAEEGRVDKFCKDELEAVVANGNRCDYTGDGTSGDTKCFCGDPNDTPEPGAI
jgi:hypothetical protein